MTVLGFWHSTMHWLNASGRRKSKTGRLICFGLLENDERYSFKVRLLWHRFQFQIHLYLLLRWIIKWRTCSHVSNRLSHLILILLTCFRNISRMCPPLSPFSVTGDSGTSGFPTPRPPYGFALPPREQSSCRNNEASEEAMTSSVYVSSHTHCVCIHIHMSLFFLVPAPRAMR